MSAYCSAGSQDKNIVIVRFGSSMKPGALPDLGSRHFTFWAHKQHLCTLATQKSPNVGSCHLLPSFGFIGSKSFSCPQHQLQFFTRAPCRHWLQFHEQVFKTHHREVIGWSAFDGLGYPKMNWHTLAALAGDINRSHKHLASLPHR